MTTKETTPKTGATASAPLVAGERKSIIDVLPRRTRLPGESSDNFAVFREGIRQSYGPITPYGEVLIERLVDLEWECRRLERARDADVNKRFERRFRSVAFPRIHEENCGATLEEEKKRKPRTRLTLEALAADEAVNKQSWRIVESFLQNLRKRSQTTIEAAERDLEVFYDVSPFEIMTAILAEVNTPAQRLAEQLRECERRARALRQDLAELQRFHPIEAEVLQDTTASA